MRRLLSLSLVFVASLSSSLAEIAIELDLTNQQAYLIQDGDIVYTSPISSGRASHPTPIGQFKVTEKDVDHRSSLYGRIVDSRGRVIKADADSDTPAPPGCRFERAPMRYFLRFDGAVGMHAGILPGYPASHGCVRLPTSKAALFFNSVAVGTPVRVYGKPPYRRSSPPPPRPSLTDRPGNERSQEDDLPPTPRPRRGFFLFRLF